MHAIPMHTQLKAMHSLNITYSILQEAIIIYNDLSMVTGDDRHS